MDISGFRSEEELIELLDAGKITVLTFVTHQSKELSEEFANYCSDRDLCQNEESAEQFVDMRQQMFNEAFENGNV